MENGSALPCYDCHDSHGSVSRALILDTQSMYGDNSSRVVVTTGFGAGSSNDLLVCSQCHDTGNSVTKAAKDNAASIGKPVEGLNPVVPYNSATYSQIHRDATIQDNMLGSGRTCLANNGGCHASPHNPLGESAGGRNCRTCHGSTFSGMDNGSTTGYHHG